MTYEPFNTARDWTLKGKPAPDWREEDRSDEDDDDDPEPTSPRLLKDITGIDPDELFGEEDETPGAELRQCLPESSQGDRPEPTKPAGGPPASTGSPPGDGCPPGS